ncbi:MAG: 3'(2'),5'-bisphosphate nucleotidase CysQ [Candidatus Hodarchaeota archaeon]
MMIFKKELKLAVELVRKATEITEWFREKGIASFLKSDQSPVTMADFASQIYIVSKLNDYFPDDEIIAEEENIDYINLKAENLIKQCFDELGIEELKLIKENITYRGKSSQRQWTIDPIDGTAGYLEGLSYAVGIGLMINSLPKICAIGVPNYNKKSLAIFTAKEGQGAQVSYDNKDFKTVRVSQREDIEKIRLCHSLHYDKPWVLNFAQNIGIRNFIQIDSMAKFCMVADGSADLYIKPLDAARSFTWDFMPGDLIVREAGGDITDLDGNRLNFKKEKCLWTAPGIIASNGVIQKKILELFKKTI